MLATVKGDVHDIGKNLVDIILTNNGYRVVNLGIKQPLAAILDAAAGAPGRRRRHVRPAGQVDRDHAREPGGDARARACSVPVLLGGAALTRAYVEDDCWKAYGEGPVAYARDAFDGLSADGQGRDRRVRGLSSPSGSRKAVAAQQQEAAHAGLRRTAPRPTRSLRPVEVEEIRLKRHELSRGVAGADAALLGCAA